MVHDKLLCSIWCITNNCSEQPLLLHHREEKEAYFTRFIQIFSDVMEKGDFDPISQEFLDRSYEEQSTSTGGFLGTGLEVKPIDTNIIGEIGYNLKGRPCLESESQTQIVILLYNDNCPFNFVSTAYNNDKSITFLRLQALVSGQGNKHGKLPYLA